MLDAVLHYFDQGGLAIMVPLTAAAALLWYGLGYRFATLRRGTRHGVRALVQHQRTGPPASGGGIIERAVARGVALQRRQLPHLRRQLDEAFLELEDEMNRHGVLVRAIVVSAPLLGLLGTVGGMIETFDSLGDMSLFSQSGGIAGGISRALFTTQLGLAVSIPGLVCGRMLDRRRDRLVAELDRLKELLCATAREGPVG